MTANILFLAHRIPFPPNRGDKIRSYHLFKALTEMGNVHIGCLGETDEDMAGEDELRRLAKSHKLVRRKKPLALAGMEALLKGRAVSLAAFHNRDLSEWVDRTIVDQRIDCAVIFSGQMGQYVPEDFRGRVVVDLCDVDFAKFAQYADQGAWPQSSINAREARLLGIEEARLVGRADATLLVTRQEAHLLKGHVPAEYHSRIHALRNGIDTQFFDRAVVTIFNPYADCRGPHIVFTGQMDYAPNEAAVAHAAHAIMPSIRAAFPSAIFHIVGRAPSRAVRSLDKLPYVKVWGEVPDIRPFLAHGDLMLAPLAIARGVQNKVLEAMAMEIPVVLSPQAAMGIDAIDGRHFLIGPTDEALIGHCMSTLSDAGLASELGKASRAFVVAQQGWQAMLAPLRAMVTGQSAEKLRCAG